MVGHSLHPKTVSQDDALKPHLLPEQFRHQLVGKQRRFSVHIRQNQVAHHHRIRPGVNARLEGKQLLLPEIVQTFVYVGGPIVCVGGGVPVTGKMLEGTSHTAPVKSPDGTGQ